MHASSIHNNALHNLTVTKMTVTPWVQEASYLVILMVILNNISPITEVPRLVLITDYSFNFRKLWTSK